MFDIVPINAATLHCPSFPSRDSYSSSLLICPCLTRWGLERTFRAEGLRGYLEIQSQRVLPVGAVFNPPKPRWECAHIDNKSSWAHHENHQNNGKHRRLVLVKKSYRECHGYRGRYLRTTNPTAYVLTITWGNRLNPIMVRNISNVPHFKHTWRLWSPDSGTVKYSVVWSIIHQRAYLLALVHETPLNTIHRSSKKGERLQTPHSMSIRTWFNHLFRWNVSLPMGSHKALAWFVWEVQHVQHGLKSWVRPERNKKQSPHKLLWIMIFALDPVLNKDIQGRLGKKCFSNPWFAYWQGQGFFETPFTWMLSKLTQNSFGQSSRLTPNKGKTIA